MPRPSFTPALALALALAASATGRVLDWSEIVDPTGCSPGRATVAWVEPVFGEVAVASGVGAPLRVGFRTSCRAPRGRVVREGFHLLLRVEEYMSGRPKDVRTRELRGALSAWVAGAHGLEVFLVEDATDAVLAEAPLLIVPTAPRRLQFDPRPVTWLRRFVDDFEADATRRARLAAYQPPRPLRVVLLGDVFGKFDGMKLALLWQAMRLPRGRVALTNLDLTCIMGPERLDRQTGRIVDSSWTPPEAVLAREMPKHGVDLRFACVGFPASMCVGDCGAYLANGLEQLARLATWADVAPEWQDVLAPLVPHFADADVVELVYFEPRDFYLLDVVRLVNPRATRVLHVGSQYRLPPRFHLVPSAEWPAPKTHDDINERPPRLRHVHSRRAVHRPRTSVEALEAHARATRPEFVSHPATLMLAPSFFVASHPDLRAAGRRVRTVLTSVDAEDAWNPARWERDAVLDARLASAGVIGPGRPAPILVGYAARLSPEKGIGELLIAFRSVRDEFRRRPRPDGRPVHLVIAGEALTPGFSALLRTLAFDVLGFAAKEVTFYGFVDPDRLGSFYRSLDILACPYANETFALAAVEGMAMGLPVVHLGAGGMQDYTVDGETNVLVPEGPLVESLAWALESLARDDARRVAIGARARAFVRRYLSHEVWGAVLWETLVEEVFHESFRSRDA